MAGLMDKIKNVFGGKKAESWDNEVPHRIQPKAQEAPAEEEIGGRWKEAKKWREERAMQEPLVKRSGFKKRL